MHKYAIYEVPRLVRSLPSPIDNQSSTVRYLCALFSELAYYHVPQWELDDRKRAKLILCEAYRNTVLATGGRSTGQTIDFQKFEKFDLPRGLESLPLLSLFCNSALN